VRLISPVVLFRVDKDGFFIYAFNDFLGVYEDVKEIMADIKLRKGGRWHADS
jgi:hypothetical protein